MGKKGINKKHGLRGSRVYSIYKNMIYRCMNDSNKRYESYGGRGIKVCDEWLGNDGLINFHNWALSNGYNDGLTIERVNVNGNYEPSNCKWVTRKEQNNNKTNNIIMNAYAPDGRVFENILNVIEFCKEHRLTHWGVYKCLAGTMKTHRGWRFERIGK